MKSFDDGSCRGQNNALKRGTTYKYVQHVSECVDRTQRAAPFAVSRCADTQRQTPEYSTLHHIADGLPSVSENS